MDELLHYGAEALVSGLMGLDRTSALAQALTFFVYDSIKIFLLLLGIIFVVSLLRTFLAPEKVRGALSRMPRFVAHLAAGGLGIITPFCSCSAIPLFLGFVEAGIPLGVTMTFLTAAPMINEVALVMLFGLFGWQIALIYVITGLVIAIIAGGILGRLKVETLLQGFVLENLKKGVKSSQDTKLTWKDRLLFARDYTLDLFKKIWPWILVGVGVGAWIHGYVPTDFLSTYAGKDNWFAVPLATIIGIPLYSNAAGVIPLIGALTSKGVAMGTALAFMMAVTALSLPEFLILRKVMKLRLLLLFAAIVGMGIIIIGYGMNFLLPSGALH